MLYAYCIYNAILYKGFEHPTKSGIQGTPETNPPWIQRDDCTGVKSCVMFPSVVAAAGKSLQSCPTLCDPMDGSPPGTPVPGILQAGTLEWVAIAFKEKTPTNEA